MLHSVEAPENQALSDQNSAAPSPCPITPSDLQAIRELRRAMVDRGYRPLAVHSPWSTYASPERRGKQPLTEFVNGEKQSWPKGHSPRRLNRITPTSANTGLLLGGPAALVALDIDPDKKSTAADQMSFARDLATVLYKGRPELRTALLRFRDPASLLLLLRADRPMTKIRIAGERGALELLGDGQQCLVHGWHPRSLDGPPVNWIWRNGRAPWNTPIAELPVVSNATLTAVMQRIEASGLLGPAVARTTTTTTVVAGRRRMSVYPATDRLKELVEKHNQLIRPAVRELIEEIGKAGDGRHDALVAVCGRLFERRWPYQEAVDFLTPLVNKHFEDGDWTGEVEAALNHAQKRENGRLAKVKSINTAVFGVSANV